MSGENVEHATDNELVLRARSGEKEAYGQLVTRYQGHVYGLAYSFVSNWAEAQDITQETFIRAYMNLDQLRDPNRFAAWLRRVTFGVAMNWLKTFRPGLFRQLEGHVDLEYGEIPDFCTSPCENVQKKELAEAVLEAIASLPPKYRVPLTMFHLNGLSYKKVAKFLDIPIGTVKTVIHRAKKKLKPALSAYASKELEKVVQEVFNEHKLPPSFVSKVLENVPTLSWGTNRECTFLGALEAALSVTAHPYEYAFLMGVSGLAFRVRWYRGETSPKWCGSSPVGEFPESVKAIQQATGWHLKEHWLWESPPEDLAKLMPDIISSIDAGKPVLVYEPALNVAVAFGYESDGKTLQLRDYMVEGEVHKLPIEELGPMVILLQEYRDPPPKADSMVQALQVAVQNWRREDASASNGKAVYRFGLDAFTQWAEDLDGAERYNEEDRKKLFLVNWWNMNCLRDARRSAGTFLRENANILEGDCAKAVLRAAATYEEEYEYLNAKVKEQTVFFGPWTGKAIDQWSPDVLRHEQMVLLELKKLESKAIAEIEIALATLK